MNLSAKWVVDRNLQIHRDGKISVSGLKENIDLGNCILMPGLVNAHVHLDYTDFRGKVPFSGSFYKWISELVRLKRTWGEQQYIDSIKNGFKESLNFGTTTLGNWVCSPDLVVEFKGEPSRVRWFLEQISIREKTSSNQWKDWVNKIEKGSVHWKADLAPHAPYTSQWNALEEMLRWTRQESRMWSIHLAESREETEMFKNRTGIMFEGFSELGRNMEDCGKGSPVLHLNPLLNEFGDVAQLVHMNDLSRSDLDLLKSVRKKPSIVHCPRSHDFFDHPPFQYSELRKMGITVALGTDSLASNSDLSMFKEMAAFRAKFPEIDAQEVVSMATREAAISLGWGNEWKEWNDWIALPLEISEKGEIFEAIVAFTEHCKFAMVDGQVVKLSS
jgi:aminodeoxyfutalosine deaminase